jgi:FkbM family methyltransferase
MGKYPKMVDLKTPMGIVKYIANCHEDLFTANEIFCMECYKPHAEITTFLDFGGNIGLSSAYFLTRNPTSIGIIYEPLTSNVLRLRENLRPFEKRISIIDKAVWIDGGEIKFGIDQTGRYSGINLPHNTIVRMNAVDVDDAVEDGIQRLGRINVMKIDIEGAGVLILKKLNPKYFEKIDCIMIEEFPFDDKFLKDLGYRKFNFDINGLFHYYKLPK